MDVGQLCMYILVDVVGDMRVNYVYFDICCFEIVGDGGIGKVVIDESRMSVDILEVQLEEDKLVGVLEVDSNDVLRLDIEFILYLSIVVKYCIVCLCICLCLIFELEEGFVGC